jgi:hypothetical protein
MFFEAYSGFRGLTSQFSKGVQKRRKFSEFQGQSIAADRHAAPLPMFSTSVANARDACHH